MRVYSERWRVQVGATARAACGFIRSGETRWL